MLDQKKTWLVLSWLQADPGKNVNSHRWSLPVCHDSKSTCPFPLKKPAWIEVLVKQPVWLSGVTGHKGEFDWDFHWGQSACHQPHVLYWGVQWAIAIHGQQMTVSINRWCVNKSSVVSIQSGQSSLTSHYPICQRPDLWRRSVSLTGIKLTDWLRAPHPSGFTRQREFLSPNQRSSTVAFIPVEVVKLSHCFLPWPLALVRGNTGQGQGPPPKQWSAGREWDDHPRPHVCKPGPPSKNQWPSATFTDVRLRNVLSSSSLTSASYIHTHHILLGMPLDDHAASILQPMVKWPAWRNTKSLFTRGTE